LGLMQREAGVRGKERISERKEPDASQKTSRARKGAEVEASLKSYGKNFLDVALEREKHEVDNCRGS